MYVHRRLRASRRRPWWPLLLRVPPMAPEDAQRVAEEAKRAMSSRTPVIVVPKDVEVTRLGRCGGCEGLGAHRRWCPEVVGGMAAGLGVLSERAEDLGDRIGALDPVAANDCYEVAQRLRDRARSVAGGRLRA